MYGMIGDDRNKEMNGIYTILGLQQPAMTNEGFVDFRRKLVFSIIAYFCTKKHLDQQYPFSTDSLRSHLISQMIRRVSVMCGSTTVCINYISNSKNLVWVIDGR